MRILWLAFLYTASTSAEGYDGSWLDPPSPQAPAFQRPVDVVTDVINELGVRILQEYGESRNSGNVAFSPTGIGFVLAALYEGSAGPGNEQIAHALGLPRDKDVTRIGLRDIHRRLRSYLSPDGFLGGLTLNRENTKLRPDYEDILKFLGFDLPSGDNGSNATDSSTSIPETTSEVPTTLISSTVDSSSPTSTEVSESPVTSTTTTQESTSTLAEFTVTSRVGDDVTTTTQVPEEILEASTRSPKEVTTPNTSTAETTTSKSDVEVMVTMSSQEISDPTTTINVVELTEEIPSTMEIFTTEWITISTTTTIPTTIKSPTTVTEVSSRLTEASSTMPTVDESTEPISSTSQLTTELTMTDAPSTITKEPEILGTTLASAEEVTETTQPGSTTLQPEESVSRETTTSMISESSTATESITTVSSEEEESNVEVLNTSESVSEVETSSSNPEDSLEELTTTNMEEGSTVEPEETSANEIVYESTTISIDTTTVDEVDEVETISTVNPTKSESENLLSMENEKMNAEITTIPSSVGMQPLERRRVRRIRIRDPVIRTLLDARSAKPEVQVTARSDLVNSKANGVVWINRVVEYSFTEQNADDSTTLRTILEKNQNKDSAESDTSEEVIIQGEAKNRGTRSPRGYFFNVPDFPSFPVYPDFPGIPEETSWTRTVGGWRVHSPKADEGSRDSSELTFLVNGEVAQIVSAATYTVVLPFAFLPTLQALALEFPLDDPRYNILLLLPTDRDGTRRLARDLGNVSLRELRKELQPAWVRAMIPSFMLKGFVTLTPFLQRLGIRDVFEPRDADLSPMTDDVGVYARDVQQSIGVNIRNYMKPDRTHSSEWNYYQAELSPPRYLPTPEPRLRAFRSERYDAWLPSWRNSYQSFNPGNGLFERAGPVSFVAEHPFLFFIIDAETGVSLIAGRIENPLNSRII